jgi:phosphohistidine phosphatase SixA
MMRWRCRPRFRRRSTGLSLAAILAASLATQNAYADNEEFWALLKKPGHIVLMRHANSPETPPDGDVKFNDCSTQRNLDDAGRAQARRVGDAFRKHGIKVAHFVSSQYCRATETAALTKLGSVQGLPALNQVYLADFSGMRETGEKSRQFMKTIPPNQLTVMVSHITNIQSIAGVTLSSGELAVVHNDQSGAVVVDGRIKIP